MPVQLHARTGAHDRARRGLSPPGIAPRADAAPRARRVLARVACARRLRTNAPRAIRSADASRPRRRPRLSSGLRPRDGHGPWHGPLEWVRAWDAARARDPAAWAAATARGGAAARAAMDRVTDRATDKDLAETAGAVARDADPGRVLRTGPAGDVRRASGRTSGGPAAHPEQDKMWPPLESAIRDAAKLRQDWRARIEKEGPAANPVDRMRRMGEIASARGAAMTRIAEAAAPLQFAHRRPEAPAADVPSHGTRHGRRHDGHDGRRTRRGHGSARRLWRSRRGHARRLSPSSRRRRRLLSPRIVRGSWRAAPVRR